MKQRRYAVIAGGGTAGHVFVALAVARALVDQGVVRRHIELVGSARGQDASLLRNEGYPVTVLAGRGIVRTLSPRSVVANALSVAGLLWALLRAIALLVRGRPQVVVSVGGYAAVPAGLAAAALRIPLVLVNIDAVPGAAHRLLGRFAAVSAVAFDATALPRAVVSGAPVRADVTAVVRSPSASIEARRILKIPPHRRTVAIFGGSLGARRLNEAAVTFAAIARDQGDLTVYHVCGARNFDVSRAAATSATLEDGDEPAALCYRLVPFEENMAALYAAADLVVCRAGALTVAELAVVGLPAIVVPLPGAPGDHQSANAAALLKAGAALLLIDSECEGARVEELVRALFEKPARLAEMATAAKALGHRDAAGEVAKLIRANAR